MRLQLEKVQHSSVKIEEQEDANYGTCEADPLDTKKRKVGKHKLKNSQNEDNSNTLLDKVVDAVLHRMKESTEIIVGVSKEEEETLITKSKCLKPKPGESKEHQEKRLLKQRILQMKSRLLLQLKMPDKAQAVKERATLQARLLREKRKVKETPEEAAARKQKQCYTVATSRKRLKELETPEQRAERIAKQNEKKKIKYQMMFAKETTEQRIARKERERSYREKYKQQSLAIKTGKIRGRPKKQQNITEQNDISEVTQNSFNS